MSTTPTGIDWVDALINPAPLTPEWQAHYDALAALDGAHREEREARRHHMWTARQYGYGRHTDISGPALVRACDAARAAERLVEETRPAE